MSNGYGAVPEAGNGWGRPPREMNLFSKETGDGIECVGINFKSMRARSMDDVGAGV